MIIKPIIAGMPALLPWDSEPSPLVSEPFSRQVQLLVGSVIVLSIGAWIVKALWNSLAKDFESLPQMSYLRALGMTLLWGLAMVVALILIDGTRHTLSPAAWVRNGFTYRLSTEEEQILTDYRNQRREQLKNLHADLKSHIEANGRTLPPSLTTIESDHLYVPENAELQYLWKLDTENSTFQIVEPELVDDVRYAITAQGEVIEWDD